LATEEGIRVAETVQVCEVHGRPMIDYSVRVVYGLRRGLKQSPAYLFVRRDRFPHCGDWVNGGSIVREARAARTWVCSECVAARDSYLAEHHPGWLASHEPESG
jgi:hypothetical protein